VRKVDAEQCQQDDAADDAEADTDDQPRVLRVAKLVQPDPDPEDEQADRRRRRNHDDRRERGDAAERELEDERDQQDENADGKAGQRGGPNAHETNLSAGYPQFVAEASYSSGDDYVVQFLGYKFSFNAADFEQRVTAAAVKLGLVEGNDLDDDEAADLVELAADGTIDDPRSGLGTYLVRHWEALSLVNGESLVYWLRKLVFRGAWLDHWVKDGRLEVAWEDETSEFTYVDPGGHRPLLELAPVPSWHELQFRR
jgi:hypothetical protein